MGYIYGHEGVVVLHPSTQLHTTWNIDHSAWRTKYNNTVVLYPHAKTKHLGITHLRTRGILNDIRPSPVIIIQCRINFLLGGQICIGRVRIAH